MTMQKIDDITKIKTRMILISLFLAAVFFNGLCFLGNMEFDTFSADTALAHFGNAAIEYAHPFAGVTGELGLFAEAALGIFAGYRLIVAKVTLRTALLIVAGVAVLTGLVGSDMYFLDFSFIGGAAVRLWGERRDAKKKLQK